MLIHLYYMSGHTYASYFRHFAWKLGRLSKGPQVRAEVRQLHLTLQHVVAFSAFYLHQRLLKCYSTDLIPLLGRRCSAVNAE